MTEAVVIEPLEPGERLMCEALVIWYIHPHPCLFPAKYRVNGKPVCGVHARPTSRFPEDDE